jgi:hypothetical protein
MSAFKLSNGAALAAAALISVAGVTSAQASGGIFEVIHPDVVEGGLELEALNTYFAEDVPAGEERSVHEIALGVGITSWWKTIAAFEIANPEEETAELEAFEWENVFLLWQGGGDDHAGHDHGHDHGHGHAEGGDVFGLYAALEVPNKAGIRNGSLSLGPIAEVGLGEVTLLGNLFVEIPFTDGEDAGLGYALAATMPVADSWKLGLEAHGDIEEAFGDAPDFDDQSHYFGPAIYHAADLGRGRVLETRFAVLPGLTDEGSRDLALSLNAELKF